MKYSRPPRLGSSFIGSVFFSPHDHLLLGYTFSIEYIEHTQIEPWKLFEKTNNITFIILSLCVFGVYNLIQYI